MKIILTLLVIFVFVLSSYVHDSFADSSQVGSDVRLSGALLDRPFALHLNETTLITSDNIRIKLLNVTSDSRCPSDVTCVWQGIVHLAVSVKKDGIDYGIIGLELGNISSAEIPIFDKYFVQLLDVKPYPKTTHKIQPGEYIATLIVKKTKTEQLVSPLKQFKSGIPIEQIQCNENLVLVTKKDGHPACVKPQAKQKLIQRGWDTHQIQSQQVTSKDGTKSFVFYDISNGLVKNIHPDIRSSSLVIEIESYGKGMLDITIPHGLVDAKLGRGDSAIDDRFFVLVNGEEVDFKENTPNKTSRSLLIPFSKNANTIEIIATSPVSGCC